MFLKMLKKIINKPIIGILFTGIIIGLIIGIVASYYYIVSNEYIQNGMSRLIFLNLQQNINIHVLFSVTGLVIFSFGWILLIRKLKFSENKTMRFLLWIGFFICSFFYFNWLSSLYFEQTFLFTLKLYLVKLGKLVQGETPFSSVFLFLQTHSLFILTIAVCIVFLFFFFRIVIRKRIQRLTGFMLKLTKSKYLMKFGILGTILIFIFNLTMLLDKKINKPNSPNIVFICIDALRADHLGCYGYSRNTSPFLDQLSKKNFLFTKAITQSSWTKSSVATFMTSKFQTLADVVEEEDKLQLNMLTLAEVLKNNKYTTIGYVSNPWLKKRFGFSQGFDYYNEDAVKTQRVEAKDVCKYISRVKNNVFFLYVHFMDVHNPYDPPSRFKETFTENMKGHFVYDDGLMPDISNEDLEYTKALYDGEIRFVDEKIEQIFRYLEDQKLLDNTVVVINSDHGDEFLEHGGLGHSTTLYNELLFVPLIIVPNAALAVTHSVVDAFVRNVDIFPTILDLASIPIKDIFDGRSLLPVINGDRRNYSSNIVLSKLKSKSTEDELISIFEKNYKYIYNHTQRKAQLFNIEKDFLEKEDLYEANFDEALKMHNKIIDYLKTPNAKKVKAKIDKETLEQLKSLGYIK